MDSFKQAKLEHLIIERNKLDSFIQLNGLNPTDGEKQRLHYIFGGEKELKKYRDKFMSNCEKEAKLFSYPIEQVITILKNTPLYMCRFAYDYYNPGRTTIDQKVQEDKIKQSIDIFVRWKNLGNLESGFNPLINQDKDSEGGHKMFVDENGTIARVNNGDKRNPNLHVKRFDYSIDLMGLTIYIICKHQENKGGFQDSAAFEMDTTYDIANRNSDTNVRFIMMLDGDFWEDRINNRYHDTNKVKTANISNFYEKFISFFN